MHRPQQKQLPNNEVRIIGGQWRSRKLKFPSVEGLRPTPNRVRETLFNWLSPSIAGARCLDLFAGSGALSFEALSRGANSVCMIDQSQLVVKTLRENAELLKATEQTTIYCANVFQWIAAHSKQESPFDIVFLDPPFHHNSIAECVQLLTENSYLAPNALIYIEAERTLQPLPIPLHWEIFRHREAGQVGYYLCVAKGH